MTGIPISPSGPEESPSDVSSRSGTEQVPCDQAILIRLTYWQLRWIKVGAVVVLVSLLILALGSRVVVRNALVNPGFESGISGWRAHDGFGQVGVTTETRHSGRQAVVCTQRSSWWSGPEQSLLHRLRAGRSYVCSGWVRVQNGDEEPVKMSIGQRDGAGIRYHEVSTTTASSNRWHFFSGRFDFKPVEPLEALFLYFEGPAGGVDLLVDDVKVVADRFLLLRWPLGGALAILGAGCVFGLVTRRPHWASRCGVTAAVLGLILLVSWLVDHRLAVVVGPGPDFAKKFQALGFENVVRGTSLDIKEDIQEPTLYQAAGVRIYGNCTTNLAIVARVAEIYGRVQGKVFFRGQKITVMANAELLGGIDSSGQVVRYGLIRSPDSGR
jgi:hypothetical protein